jgi:hypothetical protein
MKLLIQAIREIGAQRKIDVLVTTHNPALLDGQVKSYIKFKLFLSDSHYITYIPVWYISIL